jgi:uncharacterized protein (TIGR03435 family)
MSSRAAGFLLLTTSTIFGQTNVASLRFEVASVRPADDAGRGPHGVPLVVSHGRVILDDASLRQIIGHAYGVQRVRVLSCPSWCDSEGFDVIAKAENPGATENQIRQMLQTLLLERFKLVVHREKHEMQMYALVVGRHGPKLREAAADEQGGLDDRPGQLVFRKTPMSRFAALLANVLDAPVEDMTGLKGFYDFRLQVADGAAPLGTNDPLDILPNAVEYLGLELESRRRPVGVIVVDHAEKPSPN